MWFFWRDVLGKDDLCFAFICCAIKVCCDDLNIMLFTFVANLLERFDGPVNFLVFCCLMMKMKRGGNEVLDSTCGALESGTRDEKARFELRAKFKVLIVDVLLEGVFVPCNERPMLLEPPSIFHDISEIMTFLSQYDVPLARQHLLDGLSGSGFRTRTSWIPCQNGEAWCFGCNGIAC